MVGLSRPRRSKRPGVVPLDRPQLIHRDEGFYLYENPDRSGYAVDLILEEGESVRAPVVDLASRRKPPQP